MSFFGGETPSTAFHVSQVTDAADLSADHQEFVGTIGTDGVRVNSELLHVLLVADEPTVLDDMDRILICPSTFEISPDREEWVDPGMGAVLVRGGWYVKAAVGGTATYY